MTFFHYYITLKYPISSGLNGNKCDYVFHYVLSTKNEENDHLQDTKLKRLHFRGHLGQINWDEWIKVTFRAGLNNSKIIFHDHMTHLNWIFSLA